MKLPNRYHGGRGGSDRPASDVTAVSAAASVVTS